MNSKKYYGKNKKLRRVIGLAKRHNESVLLVYKVTENFPKHETYVLTLIGY